MSQLEQQNVCKSYLDPVRDNPLSPIPCQTSKQRYRLHTDTDPLFLDFPTKMRENRYTRCHRYKKDPPSIDVSHIGSQAESKCKLDHHPSPCDYISEDGSACVAHSEDLDDNDLLEPDADKVKEGNLLHKVWNWIK